MPETTQTLTEGQTAQWWNRYTAALESAATHHISVFFRTLTPPSGAHSQRAEILELLQTAVECDIIDSYDVHVLGGDICLCTTCQEAEPATQTLQTVTTLAGWHDGSLTSTGFREREVESSLTQDQYRTLVTPETALGIYLDDSLFGVFPCAADGSHYSVESHLRELLAEERAVEAGPGLRRVR